MAAQGRTNDHQSFLNSLLLMREQEIRLLSQKLHHQAALDSDGGSGSCISEGSIGSPDPHNLPMSPLRALSPAPPHPATTSQQSYRRYTGDHLSLPSSSTVPHDSAYNQRAREQPSPHAFHPLYNTLVEINSQNHHPYSRGADDASDRDVYWDPRSHHDQRQQASEEAAVEEENKEAAARMTESFLEQHQKRQQAALATQALLGSLATPSTPPHPLLSYSNLQPNNYSNLHPNNYSNLQPNNYSNLQPNNYSNLQPNSSLAVSDDGLPDMMGGSSMLVRALASSAPRRPRGEKKPIPETLKDDKYFERRKRNNLAAKKSRDARKDREDQIAVRASYLEKENSVLRAQVATLRDEASSLRLLLLQKKKK